MASTNLNMLGKTGNNEKSDECYTPKVALEELKTLSEEKKESFLINNL